MVAGGIQKSRASLQRLADIINQPLYANDEPEASLRGAAIYALERLGAPIPDIKLSSPILPRRKIAEIYAKERIRSV